VKFKVKYDKKNEMSVMNLKVKCNKKTHAAYWHKPAH